MLLQYWLIKQIITDSARDPNMQKNKSATVCGLKQWLIAICHQRLTDLCKQKPSVGTVWNWNQCDAVFSGGSTKQKCTNFKGGHSEHLIGDSHSKREKEIIWNDSEDCMWDLRSHRSKNWTTMTRTFTRKTESCGENLSKCKNAKMQMCATGQSKMKMLSAKYFARQTWRRVLFQFMWSQQRLAKVN